jgi:hypothetical protein
VRDETLRSVLFRVDENDVVLGRKIYAPFENPPHSLPIGIFFFEILKNMINVI